MSTKPSKPKPAAGVPGKMEHYTDDAGGHVVVTQKENQAIECQITPLEDAQALPVAAFRWLDHVRALPEVGDDVLLEQFEREADCIEFFKDFDDRNMRVVRVDGAWSKQAIVKRTTSP